MRLVVVVPFLDEEAHLPQLLASLAEQHRRPDQLVLVDDGSTDRSGAIARRFTEDHAWATVLSHPPRAAEPDRMLRAHELRAFQRAVDQLVEPWDAVGKVDADLVLAPDVLDVVERALSEDSALGIVGTRLQDPGGVARACPDGHVEGALAFYRRECWEQIGPLPAIIGWDTIDEVRARLRGFRVASFATPAGPSLHRRAMGSYDGLLRGYRRAGLAAWTYGAHPLGVAASTAARAKHRPLLLCGVHYLIGWAIAGLRSAPRAEREVRQLVRQEQQGRIVSLVRQAVRR